MDMWKWNLAFQCVVNIGVRGTESVRTRVVEADMVPVIATILDNYIKVTEKLREKEDKKRRLTEHHRLGRHDLAKTGSSFSNRAGRLDVDQRAFRRQAPPPIDLPGVGAPPSAYLSAGASSSVMDDSPSVPAGSAVAPQNSINSAPERSSFQSHRQHHRERETRQPFQASARPPLQPLVPAAEFEGFIRPVRDIDRLASMGPFGQPHLSSQPTSPTTPLPPQIRSPTIRPSSGLGQASRTRRRPSIRHQNSTAESDDLNGDSMQSDEAPETDLPGPAEIQDVDIQDITMDEGDGIITGSDIDLTASNGSDPQEHGTFNITHRTTMDGSLIAQTPPVVAGPPLLGMAPTRPAIANTPPTLPTASAPLYLLGRQMSPNPQVLAAMPREEDVLMSLQLLAYVSKYCNLRTYFQMSHLVPQLKIGKEASFLESESDSMDIDEDEELEEEFLLPNDLNIFPLVEKFTMRYHSTDMQYWAGVVMRNLCRKDDTRGGIRQCAHYQCGKWEEYTRQFAKCRRCRRTKYCSKDCQKLAWAFHRHWCVAATQ